MDLTPREKDKLLVAVAAMVARRRLERGVKLNYPEAVALIADFLLEGARDGRSVADLMRDGAGVIGRWLGVDAQAVRTAYGAFVARLRALVAGLPPRLPAMWQS